jgi:hypothetical protein
MSLPIVGMTLGGVITSALAVFFATKIPAVLASLGLAIGVYVGLDVFMGYAISHLSDSLNVGAVNVMGTSIDATGLLGAAGVFDAINIVLSGHVALVSIKATKVTLQGLRTP